MITKITKRNGEVVDFDVNKLLKWSEWAGVVGCDWFAIASEAYKKLPENPTTVELQDAMIKACLDVEDTPHLMMAGRLLIGHVYKELFGGHENIPSLKTMYKNMVSKGLWEEMGYSDEELDALSSVINHKKDLRSPHSVVNQIVTKYAISNVEGGKPLETPQFVWMRMALGLCKEEKEDRVQKVTEYYQDFSNGKINAPTPNIKNLGTLGRGYASCCVFKSNDSAKSLAAGDHIAYTMTCASAGIGGYIETRSKGEGVRNNTIKHSGKLPYYRTLEAAVHANLQAGRGGACTVYYNCLDPEVETLLRLRHPTTVAKNRIGGIDFAFSFHPYLAEKAAKGQKWMLVSYKACPELHEAMYRNDDSFYEIYDNYEKSKGKKKFVDARPLAIEFLRMEEETGRKYEMNIREMNRHTPFKETIYSSNLCVAPETEVLTDRGYIPINELEGQKVNVWNGEEWSNVDVIKTGENQKLVKVITSAGQTLECTEYHKWYVQVDYRNVVEKRTCDLQVGDKLIKFELPLIEGEKDLAFAYDNGFYSADGTFAGNSLIYLYHEKKALKPYLKSVLLWKDSGSENRSIGKAVGLKHKYFVPNSTYSVKSRLEWLAGFLDGDGCVARNGTNESIQAVSIYPEFLRNVQKMLQELGIHSKIVHACDEGYRLMPTNDNEGSYKEYLCKKAERLLISSSSLFKLSQLGFKTNRLKWESRLPQRNAEQFIKVEAVVDEGRCDDTYCFTEPKRHMGMFNGILTGQCLEIGLPTKGYESIEDLYKYGETSGEIALCNLGAIVAGRVSFDEYEEIAYRTLKMVDNVISIMDYPFENLRYTAQARRSAGIGITNLAHDMAEKGLKYDSIEGKQYMHRLAEIHSYSLHKASVRLAKERGKCEWFDRTKYADGWLPIDSANKFIDTVVNQPLLCDWEGLREEIKKYGMRNSVLEAYMPVESSSIAGNTTNSIYPIRRAVVSKSSGTNKNVFIAPDWEMLKGSYQFAWDIPQKDMIEMYAIFQKFCGQSISADSYRSFKEGETPRISATELIELWLYRIKCGMKTKYYTNTESGVKPIVVDETDCAGCKL